MGSCGFTALFSLSLYLQFSTTRTSIKEKSHCALDINDWSEGLYKLITINIKHEIKPLCLYFTERGILFNCHWLCNVTSDVWFIVSKLRIEVKNSIRKSFLLGSAV